MQITCFYPKAWSNLCKPMHKEGLSLRDARKFFLAMIAKIAWRIVKVKDAPWAKNLKKKYFRNKSPIRVKPSRRRSWVCKCICKGLA